MIKQLSYTPKPRTITAEENVVKVLYSFETKGNEHAKVVIKQIVKENKQFISRALLIKHSALNLLQGNFVKLYTLLRLAAYVKDNESIK